MIFQKNILRIAAIALSLEAGLHRNLPASGAVPATVPTTSFVLSSGGAREALTSIASAKTSFLKEPTNARLATLQEVLDEKNTAVLKERITRELTLGEVSNDLELAKLSVSIADSKKPLSDRAKATLLDAEVICNLLSDFAVKKELLELEAFSRRIPLEKFPQYVQDFKPILPDGYQLNRCGWDCPVLLTRPAANLCNDSNTELHLKGKVVQVRVSHGYVESRGPVRDETALYQAAVLECLLKYKPAFVFLESQTQQFAPGSTKAADLIPIKDLRILFADGVPAKLSESQRQHLSYYGAALVYYAISDNVTILATDTKQDKDERTRLKEKATPEEMQDLVFGRRERLASKFIEGFLTENPQALAQGVWFVMGAEHEVLKDTPRVKFIRVGFPALNRTYEDHLAASSSYSKEYPPELIAALVAKMRYTYPSQFRTLPDDILRDTAYGKLYVDEKDDQQKVAESVCEGAGEKFKMRVQMDLKNKTGPFAGLK